ncbi:hypothetical protein QTN25_001111 [Entamoeba marina]
MDGLTVPVGESSFEEGVDDNDRIDRVSLDGNEVIDDNEVVTDEVLNDDTNPIFDQNLIEINEDDDNDFNQSVDGSGHTVEHQVNTGNSVDPNHNENEPTTPKESKDSKIIKELQEVYTKKTIKINDMFFPLTTPILRPMDKEIEDILKKHYELKRREDVIREQEQQRRRGVPVVLPNVMNNQNRPVFDQQELGLLLNFTNENAQRPQQETP